MARYLNLIKSAGCLIIGDEVLNGKILDTNSHVFSKFCFNELKIPVKSTVVCGDDYRDIRLSLEFLLDRCDVVVTSGGIGPTHDDITYEAIAQTFGTTVEVDDETVARMKLLRAEYLEGLSSRKLEAYYRMATFPKAGGDVLVEKMYTDESLWVPVVGINKKVYVLPGVPQLFEKLLFGMKPHLQLRVDDELVLKRMYVKTEMKESDFAPFLSDLQHECDENYGEGTVKLGSYPHMNWKVNTVSIIGNEKIGEDELRALISRVEENVIGKQIGAEEEEYMSQNEPGTAE